MRRTRSVLMGLVAVLAAAVGAVAVAGSAAAAGPTATFTKVSDYKLIKPLLSSGYQLFRDTSAGFAWIFNGSTMWTFDDPTEIARKTAWAKDNGLGGAMVWSLDGDTTNGELIAAVSQGIG